jgi:Ala-tRNA(Pro) deacylase
LEDSRNSEETVHDRILGKLRRLQIPYDRLEHPPVRTCDDSAAHRKKAGWTGVGSKCILFHAKGQFYLVITTAEREIKARLFKKPFGTKNIRFASAEELIQHSGCTAGAVAPFGHFSIRVPYFVDERIFANKYFMFTPGIPSESIRISTDDLRKIYSTGPNPLTWYSAAADGKFEFVKNSERLRIQISIRSS